MLRIQRFEIVGRGSPRPEAEKILFCDGTGGSLYRAETDLELSHWRPNRTPTEYRAGTSTEICFRFLEAPRPGAWAVAVNNHVDVDGMLSVYSLVESEHALGHRRTIVEAAEMGDFWGWGEPPAQRLFQGLTRLMDGGRESGRNAKEIFSEAFRRVPGLIDGTDPSVVEIEESLAPLRRGVELVDRGRIRRVPVDRRLSRYEIPLDVAGDDALASYTPGFNEAISPQAMLWPQVRARQDSERVCLVSTARPAGWFHDLCCPGYLWADTEGKWLVPGLAYHDGMSSYDIRNARLIDAFRRLQQEEPANGQWSLGGTDLPSGKELQEAFPVVGRFLGAGGKPDASRLPPERVGALLEGVFC